MTLSSRTIFAGWIVSGLALLLGVLAPGVYAADKTWKGPFNNTNSQYGTFFRGTGTYNSYGTGTYWDPTGYPGSGDRIVFDNYGFSSRWTAVDIHFNTSANRLLVEMGEVDLRMRANLVINSTSIDPAMPTVDVSGVPNTRLWIWGGSSVSGSPAFTSLGLTVVGKDSGTYGQLMLGQNYYGTYGSAKYNTNRIIVGNEGQGSVLVELGADLDNSSVGYIGYSSSSSSSPPHSSVTVRDSGSQWMNDDAPLFVGYGGKATLNVQHGGYVRSDIGYVGYQTTSTGTATVSGTGAQWINDNQLYVGLSGDATLNVQAGGYVFNSSGYIGNDSTSTSTATITGTGSQWYNNGTLIVGNSGDATLDIQNGGYVRNSFGAIGYQAGSVSSVTVNGANSRWINTSDAVVGRNGNATLNITNGGRVENSSGYIGYNSGSIGIVTVGGTNARWDNTLSLFVGGSSVGPGGNASLTIASGGLVTAGSSSRVWHAGQVDVQNGGAMSVTGSLTNYGLVEIATGGQVTASSTSFNLGTVSNNGVFNGNINTTSGGLLTGSGTFNGVVQVYGGGYASPGNSPGAMSSPVTVWGGHGHYIWEINALANDGGVAGSDPGWDIWHTGSLSMAGPFFVDLTTLDAGNNNGLLAGWDAYGSYQWLIATSTNYAFLNLSNLVLTLGGFQNALEGGLFSLSNGSGGNALYLNYSNPNPAPAVPEPGSIAAILSLVSFGAGVVVIRRRRMRTIA